MGYTYCIELATSEAQAKVAGKDMIFNKPVFFYVDNFLGMPAGIQVPSAYFDPDRGLWIPSPDGRVVQLLGTNSSGLRQIDLTGGGTPAAAEDLAALGFTDAERRQLAVSYPSNQSVWRVPMTHLSTYDCNYGVITPQDAVSPPLQESFTNQKIDESDASQQPGYGSLVLQNQVFRESIKVVGTPFQLHYSSDLVPGSARLDNTLVIPLSGSAIPASLKEIDMEIHIAGRTVTETFPAQKNLQYVFEWDGRDSYGRPLVGNQAATIRIGYVYDGYYALPPNVGSSFGLPSGRRIPGNIPARRALVLWSQLTALVGRYSIPVSNFGGWSLTPYHRYDTQGRVLYFGDGSRRTSQKFKAEYSVDTYAGGRDLPHGAGFGDGGPALKASLSLTGGLMMTRNGYLYAATDNGRIRVVDPAGNIDTVAGGGTMGFSGDGGFARQAQFNFPYAFAMNTEEVIYVADGNNGRIRVLSPVLPGFTEGDIYLPSEDGGELYCFSADGRHRRTLNSLTGAIRFEFAHDSAGQLAAITDGDGNRTRIQRDAGGMPLAIISPYGQRTELTLDASGYLAGIANPAGETTRLSYAPGGLLTGITGPRNTAYSIGYDALGRAVQASDPAGGFSQLTRSQTTNGYAILQITAEARTNRYEVATLSTTAQRLTDSFASGEGRDRFVSAGGVSSNQWANGVLSL